MIQFPKWVSKIQALWVLIGALLTGLAASVGIEVPDFLSGIFSQVAFDAVITVITAVFTFYQTVKAIFVVTPAPAGTIKVLSNGEALAYALNPFKLRAA